MKLHSILMDSTTRIDDLPENVTMRVQNDATSKNVHSIHRLPSRDIPMDQTNYQQDEEIQSNYMPRVKFADDYVKDYENLTDVKIKHHERGKARSSIIDRICTDLQTPIFVALLFFIFQMPLVNTMFFRRFSFLSIYNSDGNVNFYGIALKSILFGSAFYMLDNTIEYLTDI